MNNLYREIRRSIGTKKKVADLLGVSRFTLRRREEGLTRITNEHMQAIRNLAKPKLGKVVKLTTLDRKKGMKSTEIEINTLLKESGSRLSYVEEYGTFMTRDRELFKKFIAEQME